MAKTPQRPRDPNQLAKLIVGLATGSEKETIEQKNKARQSGGLRGGKARAEKLSSEERKKIAEKAAKARWDKD